MIPDLHDYVIDNFNWARTEKTAALFFSHSSLPSVSLLISGIHVMRFSTLTETNIVGDANCVALGIADNTFWEGLFEGIVPIQNQTCERSKVIQIMGCDSKAFSIDGCYGGSLWVVCKTTHFKVSSDLMSAKNEICLEKHIEVKG